MKAYGGVDVQIHVFLTSALVGGEWSASYLDRFNPAERAHGAGWAPEPVDMGKFSTLPGLEIQPFVVSWIHIRSCTGSLKGRYSEIGKDLTKFSLR
jgi:hypothetical protein